MGTTLSGDVSGKPQAAAFLLEDRDHARAVYQILHTAWWAAYSAKHKGATESEVERISKGALDRIVAEAKLRFGNNRAHPDCDYCLTVSVFGGPGHEPSSLCRSGKRPHCTCSACF
jgi:hypothetical protein